MRLADFECRLTIHFTMCKGVAIQDPSMSKKAVLKHLISLKGCQHNGICDQCDNKEDAYEAPWLNDFLSPCHFPDTKAPTMAK